MSNKCGFVGGDIRVILNNTNVIRFAFQASRHQRGFDPLCLFAWVTNSKDGVAG